MQINGLPVRDYAFTWAAGGDALQQWASGAVGVTPAVIQHVETLMATADAADRKGLAELLVWLQSHAGEPASPYTPGA